MEFMKIAFYAPLKSPEHPIPSGDRQMARALIKSLQLAGHNVELVSQFRSFSKTPHSREMVDQATDEAARIMSEWGGHIPDLWLSYHPYYKAPDFIGAKIHRKAGIPVFTIEASLAGKRDRTDWADSQAVVRDMVKAARANFYFTDRDRKGLAVDVKEDRLIYLPPFIDIHDPVPARHDKSGPVQLVTMGMMRGGVKFDSYQMLAEALAGLEFDDWQLSIIGDGPDRVQVEALFARFDDGKINWLGQLAPSAVSGQLAEGDIFVWPGFGEAYGLAYLEAQATGLPVVAQNTHGVPWVVRHGKTGILTKPGDVNAYRDGLMTLMSDRRLARTYGDNARAFVVDERNLAGAGKILDGAIRKWL